MREIKFRGRVYQDNRTRLEWWYATPEDSDWYLFWLSATRDTVGEYTGCADHTGKEAYEGDIVELSFDGEPEDKTTAVLAFHHGAFKFDVMNSSGVRTMSINMENEDKWRVIGNIYEHPSLLAQ